MTLRLTLLVALALGLAACDSAPAPVTAEAARTSDRAESDRSPSSEGQRMDPQLRKRIAWALAEHLGDKRHRGAQFELGFLDVKTIQSGPDTTEPITYYVYRVRHTGAAVSFYISATYPDPIGVWYGDGADSYGAAVSVILDLGPRGDTSQVADYDYLLRNSGFTPIGV